MKRFALLAIRALIVFASVSITACTQRTGSNVTQVPFTISKETTCVTEPRTDDGLIDYAAALNERMSRDVTPQTNAAAFFHRAFGPQPAGTSLPNRFYQELGISRPAEDGEYFVTFRDFLKNKLGEDFDDPRPSELLDHAMGPTKRPWTPEELPPVAAWLQANQRPLAMIVRGTEQPDYYRPLIPEGEQGLGLAAASFPEEVVSRSAARALVARAMLKAGRGQSEEAWDDLLASYRLGNLTGQGATLMGAVVAIHIELTAMQAVPNLIGQVKPNAELARRWQRHFEDLPGPPDTAEKVGLDERFVFLDLIQIGAVTTSPSRSSIDNLNTLVDMIEDLEPTKADWDAAMKLANRWYDRASEAMAIEDPQQRYAALKELEKDLEKVVDQPQDFDNVQRKSSDSEARAAGEQIGSRMLALLRPPFRKAQVAEDRAKQWKQNVTVALALAAYRDVKGGYPTKLAALTPDYLDQLPADAFTGEPLQYRATERGYLLYSAGENQRDDSGRSYQDQPNGDDLRIRMPPEPAVATE